MNLEMSMALELVKEAEGFYPNTYRCPAGKLTQGYGRNLEVHPLSDKEKAELNEDGSVSKEVSEKWELKELQECEEKLQLKNELVKIQLEATLKANEQANEAENQITERWKSDNEHIVTRLVRPLSYAWVIFLFTTVIIGDGNFGFSVKDAYIPVLETLLTTMTIAYFGARTIEKFRSIK